MSCTCFYFYTLILFFNYFIFTRAEHFLFLISIFFFSLQILIFPLLEKLFFTFYFTWLWFHVFFSMFIIFTWFILFLGQIFNLPRLFFTWLFFSLRFFTCRDSFPHPPPRDFTFTFLPTCFSFSHVIPPWMSCVHVICKWGLIATSLISHALQWSVITLRTHTHLTQTAHVCVTRTRRSGSRVSGGRLVDRSVISRSGSEDYTENHHSSVWWNKETGKKQRGKKEEYERKSKKKKKGEYHMQKKK